MEAFDASSRRTEVTPRSLRKLEVGTASGSSHDINAIAGYDPRVFEPGTEVTTVDLLSRFRRPQMKRLINSVQDDLINAHDLKASYSSDSIWFSTFKDELPLFKHNVVVADGRKLPFADDTFEQTLMVDVIGDPSVDNESARRLLYEALRVSDELMVVEDRTPVFAAKRFARGDFDMAGITVRELAVDDYVEYVSRKSMVRSHYDPDIYVLTKNEQWDENRRSLPVAETSIAAEELIESPVEERMSPRSGVARLGRLATLLSGRKS